MKIEASLDVDVVALEDDGLVARSCDSESCCEPRHAAAGDHEPHGRNVVRRSTLPQGGRVSLAPAMISTNQFWNVRTNTSASLPARMAPAATRV